MKPSKTHLADHSVHEVQDIPGLGLSKHLGHRFAFCSKRDCIFYTVSLKITLILKSDGSPTKCLMRSALFWGIMKCRMVILYQPFGTTL